MCDLKRLQEVYFSEITKLGFFILSSHKTNTYFHIL